MRGSRHERAHRDGPPRLLRSGSRPARGGARRASRRDRLRDRRKRRGENHAPQDHRRRAASRLGAHHRRRPGHHGPTLVVGSAPRHHPRARRARRFRRSKRARQSPAGRPRALERPRCQHAALRPRRRPRPLSRPRRETRAARSLAVRRTATDAGGGARAHGTAPPHAPRRAVAGPGAHPRARDLRGHPAAARAGRDHSPRGADGRAGPRPRRPRLRPRARAHHPRRILGGRRPQPRRARGLPGQTLERPVVLMALSPATRMPLAMSALASAASLHVARVGSVTLGRLARAPEEAARVHSVFERAINLQWHDGHLLTLQGPGLLAAPFAVALSALPPRSALARGTIVHRSCLDWTRADSVSLEVPASRVAIPADVLPKARGAATLRAGRGRRSRRALADSLVERDGNAFAAAATDLIGLGEGLTPAGDDCVVGALAAIHHLAPGLLERRAVRAIAEAARHRTTDVARDFLLEALAGRFAEPVLAILAAPSAARATDAARRLLAMGATSGADTLDGLRLAGCALARRAAPLPIM